MNYAIAREWDYAKARTLRTPWGQADSVREYPNGIRWVGTPSHGGFWVPAKVLAAIPEMHQLYALKWSGSRQWYEEDCAWACVALAFPEFFTVEDLSAARDTVRRWISPPPDAPPDVDTTPLEADEPFLTCGEADCTLTRNTLPDVTE